MKWVAEALDGAHCRMPLKQQSKDSWAKATEEFLQKLTAAEAYFWVVVAVVVIALLVGRGIYLAAH
jgi:hypothetical protein